MKPSAIVGGATGDQQRAKGRLPPITKQQRPATVLKAMDESEIFGGMGEVCCLHSVLQYVRRCYFIVIGFILSLY